MNVSPNLGGSLEDWLEGQISRHSEWFRKRPALVDVGAYFGEFSHRFLDAEESPFQQAILFEPNPENFAALQRRWPSDERVHLERLACGERSGTSKLVCQGEGYTGSLLARRQDRPGTRTDYEVSVIALDDYLSRNGASSSVGLLKLDTQGNDLRALQGSVCVLGKSRPWIVVEMLATPRFVNQAAPAEITQFLEAENYFFAAAMNEFYTATGWLAWFDACFIPRELFTMDMNANLPRPSASHAGQKKFKRLFNRS